MQITPSTMQPAAASHRHQTERPSPVSAEGRSAHAESSLHGTERAADKDAQLTRELQQLQARDREVRSHEMAHLAAAGNYATSGASFTYSRGPDGKLYAVAGEVGIDISQVPGDPQATLEKAATIRRAALAPSNPSAQDRQVAAQAARMTMEAHAELQRAGHSDQQTRDYQEVEQFTDEEEPQQRLSTHA